MFKKNFIITKNIFDHPMGIVVHQCNAMHKMGAGLALDIKNKYPIVFYDYMKTQLKLGDVIFSNVSSKLIFASLISQKYYGRNKNIIYTNYNAFENGIRKIKEFNEDKELLIIFPYKIGCGLANGNRKMVYDIIKNTLNDYEER